MPTTSGELATRLLDVLSGTRAEFLVLHREADIAHGLVTSDLDLAVGDDVFATIRALVGPAGAAGLVPVAAWPYDLTSMSTFWCTHDARDGVQLDLTHDPEGLGRYGFRTGEMLARATSGTRWPVPDELDGSLYLLRKRQMKADASRSAEALAAVRSHRGAESADTRASSLFSRPAAESVSGLLRGRPSARNLGVSAHVVRSSRRIAWRIAHPIGFWAEIEGKDLGPSGGDDVAERFRRFLVGSVSVARGDARLRGQVSLWREFVQRRWRAQLLVTTVPDAGRARHPQPDLTVSTSGHDLDSLCACIVTAMRDRTLSMIPNGRRAPSR